MAKTRKSPIALALSETLDLLIREAAKAGGRTLTAEIGMRLAASFDKTAINQSSIRGGSPSRSRSIAALAEHERLAASEKLASKLKADDSTGCHLFTGSLNYSGYGTIYISGVQFATHRLAYELSNGPINGDGNKRWVLHHCDTPACCNPKHLYLGDPADNSRDMALRARMRSGDRPQCGWQTEEDANKPTGTVFWEFDGQVKELKEWSQILGVNSCTLDSRFRSGWPPENIQRTPALGFKNWPKRSEARHSYRRFSGQEAVAEYINSQGVQT